MNEFCEIKDTLNDTLRDRYVCVCVCGLTYDKLRKKLLSEKNLTHQKAFEIVAALKTATNHAIEIQKKHFSSTSGVHKLSFQKSTCEIYVRLFI